MGRRALAATACGGLVAAALLLLAPPAPGQAPETLEKGRQLYFEGEYDAAFQQWAPLAERGNPRALYNMATLYRRGLGVEKDRERGRSLLTRSAEAGFAEAQYLLAALIMREEKPSETDRQAAAQWWLTAARQGHTLSQYRLGLLYWNGEAVARDLLRGYAWMRLAAQDGLDDATSALETMKSYLGEDQREKAEALQGQLLDQAPAAERSAPAARTAASQEPADAAEKSAGAGASKGGAPTEPETAERASAKTAPDSAKTEAAGKSEPGALGEAWRLQLAAFRDRETAEATWRDVQETAPDLVDGLRHRIVTADLGERGVFHRLQIGPFADRDAAERRCRALKAAGYGCFAVSPDS